MSTSVVSYQFRFQREDLVVLRKRARKLGCLFVVEEHGEEGTVYEGIFSLCTVVAETLPIMLQFLLDIGWFDDVRPQEIQEHLRTMKQVNI